MGTQRKWKKVQLEVNHHAGVVALQWVLTQLPADAFWEEADDGPSVWALSPTWETKMEFWTPSTWPSLDYRVLMENGSEDDRFLSVTLPFKEV